ncbi:MAG: 4-hydroxy-tetrahydrodipicolinate synthase [Alphaproteobacteria bacterium]|nr:4-hydroxy-tetrahydrodipicolinate synthase [Alphaproteobacteria bacterium]MBE8221040.1 4-hydroxy-tetrahydrodipicolinate synthase [Alphaproteobacteria bacterium]
MFKGSIVAAITPLADGGIDEPALRALVEWHIEQGTHGLVPCGTTGESPTLTYEEHNRVVALCAEVAAGRIKIIAGAGSNATHEAIAFTRHAQDVGADAALLVTPYYNKPTQAGLVAHYTAINECVQDFPLIVYNVPPRSAVDVNVETMAILAGLSNIVGVKDATADLARVPAQQKACGDDFILLSGEDALALAFMKAGGHGCISVSANIAPALCAQFQVACMAGDYATAQTLHDKLLPLHEALFCETSPQPVKYAAHRLGLCKQDIRLPLLFASAEAQAQVDKALETLGLL